MTHSAEPELEITVSDHHWSAGHWGPMLIFVWRGVTSVERVTTVGRLTSEVAARCPNGVGVLVVLEPEASTPNEEARKLLASVMRDRSAVVKGLAYAVVGAGFGAAAVRAVIAGLSLLAREERGVKDGGMSACSRLNQGNNLPLASINSIFNHDAKLNHGEPVTGGKKMGSFAS